MCGIVGYIGTKDASKVLLGGLFDLEYRGYDSAGIKMIGQPVVKAVGPVKNLEKKLNGYPSSHAGIAHTRWATHGLPTIINAHPHGGAKGAVWLVHNGIIENYIELKAALKKKGIRFASDTDTEVLVQLIESEFQTVQHLEEAVRRALRQVRGAYGIVACTDAEPDRLVVARMGSPLVLGVGKNECIVASDVSPIVKHTKRVVYLEDGELAVITKDGYTITDGAYNNVEREEEEVAYDGEEAKKEGFAHFMQKEIFEGPSVVQNTMRGRVQAQKGEVKLGGIECVADRLKDISRIHIVGCGSAYYAGLYGKYVIEALSGIAVDVDYASEFRYRKPVLDKNAGVLAISQSGETADTLEAIREGKRQRVLTLGIVNVVGSTIARETDAGVYNHAGPEISVASTKAFISQMTVLLMLAVYLGRLRTLAKKDAHMILSGLESLPKKMQQVLKSDAEIEAVAQEYAAYNDFLYIGRTLNFPIALEGALKLKEVSYIHAEGYSAGEMKHGPIAMIDENFPTVAIAPKDEMYAKMMSNIEEIRARGGKVVLVSDAKSDRADAVLKVPEALPQLSPILNLIPLQLFAYHIAVSKGLDVDRPRNLAKSVTVE